MCFDSQNYPLFIFLANLKFKCFSIKFLVAPVFPWETGVFSGNVIRDTPPENFVTSIGDVINDHLLIDCDDDPNRLTINNQDLLANGGLVKINSFDEFMSFTVIKRKHLVAGPGSGQADGIADKLAKKAT